MARNDASRSASERLLNVVLALVNAPGALTRAQLRNGIDAYRDIPNQDAFARQLERDKATLIDLGVPLITVNKDGAGDSVGYRIDLDSYAMAPVTLTPAEAAVVTVAASLWQDRAVREDASRLLVKVRAASHDATDPSVLPDLLPAGTAPAVTAGSPQWTALVDATANRREVKFDYVAASSGDKALRRVQPWQVLVRRGTWYLIGFDVDRAAPRVFNLARAVGSFSVARAAGTYPAPDPEVLAEVRRQLDPPPNSQALLAIRPQRGGIFRAAGTPQGTRAGLDLIAVPFAHAPGFAQTIAPYGADVLVVEPAQLREEVTARFAAAIALPQHVGRPRHLAAPYKPDYSVERADARLVRMLGLVAYASARGQVPIPELAARFGVTSQEIIDDVNALWLSGVLTPRGGVRTHDQLIDFDWDAFDAGIVEVRQPQGLDRPLRLAARESIVLGAALRALAELARAGGDAEYVALVEQVAAKVAQAAGSAPGVEALALDVTPPAASHLLGVLADARREGRTVSLAYTDARDHTTARHALPLEIDTGAAYSYLTAWDIDAAAVRTFRIDRIGSAQVDRPATDQERTLAESALAGHPGATAAGLLHGEARPVTVVAAPPALAVLERLPAESFSVGADGEVTVTVQVGDDEWFAGVLLAIAPWVRVVSAHPAIDLAAARAQAALSAYQALDG